MKKTCKCPELRHIDKENHIVIQECPEYSWGRHDCNYTLKRSRFADQAQEFANKQYPGGECREWSRAFAGEMERLVRG